MNPNRSKPYRGVFAQLKAKTTLLTEERGTALLVTLAIITVILAVSLEINRQARSAIGVTEAHTNKAKLIHMANAGVQAAMAMLVKDRYDTDTDHLLEPWADQVRIAALLETLTFEAGSVAVSISDELSRIQVNALVQHPERRDFNDRQEIVWDQFIRGAVSQGDTFQEVDPAGIINTAKDWLDRGDDDAATGLSGAESDYYQGLDPPYACANGPFNHIAELALLKDFPAGLLQGSPETPGLQAYLTVHGAVDTGDGAYDFPGRINLNTAATPVIAALLPWEDLDKAPAIVDFRQVLIETDNQEAFADSQWYQQAPGCSDVEIDPELLMVASDLFRIESAAVLDGARLSMVVVVQREKQAKTGRWVCKPLQWESK